MPESPTTSLGPRDLVRLLLTYPRRWVVPTLVLTVLAAGYALFGPVRWEASQAMILRNDAASGPLGPGKFTHSDEMKTAQETIVELVRSRPVLEGALAAVSPPATHGGRPTAEAVAQLRDDLRVAPPKGAELGKTEVFYLKVKHVDRLKAAALSDAVVEQLERRLRELRNVKAQSMIAELGKTVQLARADLADSVERLTAVERGVGSDLAELRVLHDPGFGDSALRRSLTEIHNELRQAQAAERVSAELLTLLESTQKEPGRLLAAPSRLLEAQPALRRLKEALVDAQVRTAQIQGQRSDAHPLVSAGRESEAEIGRHIRAELEVAIRGLAVERRLAQDRAAVLEHQVRTLEARLAQLAEVRATYSSLVAEVKNRDALLARAEQGLADARAVQAGAAAASLLGRIDTPDTGVKPTGPGASMIVLAGLVGGLAVGFGLVLLTADWPGPVVTVGTDARPTAADAFLQTRLSLKEALRRATAAESRTPFPVPRTR